MIPAAILRRALEDMLRTRQDGPRDGLSFRYRGSVYVDRDQLHAWLREHGHDLNLTQVGASLRTDFGFTREPFQFTPPGGDGPTSMSCYRSENPDFVDGLPEWPGPRNAARGGREYTPQNDLDGDGRPPDAAGRLDTPTRLAVEARAEARVTEHYTSNGWRVTRVANEHRGWDLTAQRPGSEDRHIEVKGSTGKAIAVEITRGELAAARRFPTRAVLAIVAMIRLVDGEAIGGDLEILDPWLPVDDELTETRYSHRPAAEKRRRIP